MAKKPLDLNKIKNMEDELHAGGKGNFFYPKNLKTGDTDIRIAPPVDDLDGHFCFKLIQYWINKKPYISNSTFGGSDVMAEELELAAKKKDRDLDDLISKVNQKDAWLFPFLLLKAEFRGSTCTSCETPKEWAVFSANKMLITEITNCVTDRWVQPDITDRVNGTNIMLTKKGADLNTEYYAKNWRDPLEIKDASLYEEGKIPNVVQLAKDMASSDEYLRKIIRNYLYNEPMPKPEDRTVSGKDERGSGRGEERGREDNRGREDSRDDRGRSDDRSREDSRGRDSRTETKEKETPKEENKNSSTFKASLDDELNNL